MGRNTKVLNEQTIMNPYLRPGTKNAREFDEYNKHNLDDASRYVTQEDIDKVNNNISFVIGYDDVDLMPALKKGDTLNVGKTKSVQAYIAYSNGLKLMVIMVQREAILNQQNYQREI